MSDDMRAFLDFLCGEEARSDMTKEIAKSVEDAKSYKPWEAEYIGYYLEMAREREAGREEGLKQGLEQGREEKKFDDVGRLVASGLADLKKACEVLDVDIDAYRASIEASKNQVTTE